MSHHQQRFPTFLPTQIPPPAQSSRWLVDQLWLDQACGIIGAEPKCCKTHLALSLAVAVASGLPALRRFKVHLPGPVLLYCAEHSAPSLRTRIEAIARHLDCHLDDLNIHIIPNREQLRLDRSDDQQQLAKTIGELAPRLLILDPLTRIHQVNENLTAELSPILDCLRSLQQRYRTAVMLVHHSRKSTNAQHGQSLRGTSDLHAWGDSNLYLSQNRNNHVTLSTEHRTAASSTFQLRLHTDNNGPLLRLCAS